MYYRFFSVLLFLVFSTFSHAKSITIVADEWLPYNGKPDSSKPGYGIEIAKAIFHPEQIEVKYRTMPWSRAIDGARQGLFTAIIGAYREEAPDFIFPEHEFGLSSNGLYALRALKIDYRGTHSLLDHRIGVIKGYSYGDAVDSFIRNNPKGIHIGTGTQPLATNIRLLMSGRVDLLIEDQNVLRQAAQEIRVLSQIRKVTTLGKGNSVYVAFSPAIAESEQLAQLFDQGMQKLKASGKLNQILNRYGLLYWR